MISLPRGLLADVSPGPPLISNNASFYAVVGAALLALLLLVLWIRRRGPRA